LRLPLNMQVLLRSTSRTHRLDRAWRSQLLRREVKLLYCVRTMYMYGLPTAVGPPLARACTHHALVWLVRCASQCMLARNTAGCLRSPRAPARHCRLAHSHIRPPSCHIHVHPSSCHLLVHPSPTPPPLLLMCLVRYHHLPYFDCSSRDQRLE